MRKIFCLETEWVQSVHSLKSSSSALLDCYIICLF